MSRRLVAFAHFKNEGFRTLDDGRHDLIIPDADWIKECVGELKEGERLMLFIAAVTADEFAARGDGERSE